MWYTVASKITFIKISSEISLEQQCPSFYRLSAGSFFFFLLDLLSTEEIVTVKTVDSEPSGLSREMGTVFLENQKKMLLLIFFF